MRLGAKLPHMSFDRVGSVPATIRYDLWLLCVAFCRQNFHMRGVLKHPSKHSASAKYGQSYLIFTLGFTAFRDGGVS